MMKTTSKMSLRVWNSLDDDFDHEQLADNWAKIDAHDHTDGRGVQLVSESIAEGQIKHTNLAEEILNRLFSETSAYTTAESATADKPYNVPKRSFVELTVTTTGAAHIEVKIGGVKLTELSATGVFPIGFFVPAGKSWEWHKVSGTVAVTFKTAEY